MSDQTALQVRRVEVTEPIAVSRRHDYADAFETRLPAPDTCSPEAWVRAGIEASSPAVKRIVALLGFRPASSPSVDRMGAWRVVESTPEVIHLELSLPLMHVALVGRRVELTRRVLTTVLDYQRPVLARLVWVVVGVAHRRTARRVLTSKVATAARSGDEDTERAS